MRNTLSILLGAALALNGVLMLLASETWYQLTPGVRDTGPFNLHFVRDIGCAYLVAGGSVLFLLRDPRLWPAAMAAGAFLALHAATHVYDFALGRISALHALSDTALVVAPALLVLGLARKRQRLVLEGRAR